MREILFRAKLADEDTWVEGSLVVWKGDTMIYTDRGFPHFMGNFLVEPETVGQFTGLTDKNGKKIFEGDIVKYPDTYLSWLGDVDVKGNVGAVEWDKATMCFYFSNRIAVEMEEFFVLNGCMTEVEVIGNIHDNPELIGGADNG